MPNIIEGVKTIRYKAINSMGQVSKAYLADCDAKRAAEVMKGWVVEA